MRRREFITLLGSAAATWPLAARAQQAERTRRIGVLMSSNAESDLQTGLAAFVQVREQLGWAEGRNPRIETRWAGGDARQIRAYAAELVALAPDVILVNGAAGMERLLEATRTIPIVFCGVPDPVGAGFVDSLARPLAPTGPFTSRSSVSTRRGV